MASMAGTAGFPEGPWGRYLPFKHPKTGEDFHVRDTFDVKALGYDYDEVPIAQPPQVHATLCYAMPG